MPKFTLHVHSEINDTAYLADFDRIPNGTTELEHRGADLHGKDIALLRLLC